MIKLNLCHFQDSSFERCSFFFSVAKNTDFAEYFLLIQLRKVVVTLDFFALN